MTNLDVVYDVDDRTTAFENHERGILVSLAGPGTGKTYSLLKRIKALTRRGENENTICYLTFIKEISNAFISDYIENFGLDSYRVNNPRISTLHSFACRLIRNQGFRINYDGELYFMSIVDSDDGGSDIFLQDLLPFVTTTTIHTPPQLRNIIDQIKVAWQKCTDIRSFKEPITSILSICLHLLQSYRLIDWDQTIFLANILINNLEEQPTWISQIDHFLVDEYQDFNLAEQKFITALSSSAKSMVIVGDDNQSLYSKRGGSPDGLRNLFNLDEYDQVSLLRCRRCRLRIVEAANTFLTTMCLNPRPMLPLKDGGEIYYYGFKSTKTEIEYLINFLNQSIIELPEEPQSKDGIICLFPSWRVLNFYFDQLSPYIPCSKRKSQPLPLRLWLQRSIELALHPNQRFIERLILDRYKAIKPRHRKAMVNLILQCDISPSDAMENLIASGLITGLVASQATQFCEFCHALSSQDPLLIARQLCDILDIDVNILHHRLENFFLNVNDPEQEDNINHLCDDLIPDSAQPPEDPYNILFLTMHGSKGLTKKTVVMPGLEEAWLPGDSKGHALEEKKRQFYVALTRATDLVLITFPRRRLSGDPLNYPAYGRGIGCSFIHESGISFIYKG